jgi:hypothetical protein
MSGNQYTNVNPSFALFLNLAINNIRIAFNKEDEDKINIQNLSDEEYELAERKHFQFIYSEKYWTLAERKKMFEIAFRELKELRHLYSHAINSDYPAKEIYDKGSGVEEKTNLYRFMLRKFNLAKESRAISEKYSKDSIAHLEELTAPLDNTLEPKEFELQKLNRLFLNSSENRARITHKGIAFFASFFLDKKQCNQLWSKMIGMKGTHKKHFRATRDIFSYFSFRHEESLLLSENPHAKFVMTALAYLQKVPKSIFELRNASESNDGNENIYGNIVFCLSKKSWHKATLKSAISIRNNIKQLIDKEIDGRHNFEMEVYKLCTEITPKEIDAVINKCKMVADSEEIELHKSDYKQVKFNNPREEKWKKLVKIIFRDGNEVYTARSIEAFENSLRKIFSPIKGAELEELCKVAQDEFVRPDSDKFVRFGLQFLHDFNLTENNYFARTHIQSKTTNIESSLGEELSEIRVEKKTIFPKPTIQNVEQYVEKIPVAQELEQGEELLKSFVKGTDLFYADNEYEIDLEQIETLKTNSLQQSIKNWDEILEQVQEKLLGSSFSNTNSFRLEIEKAIAPMLVREADFGKIWKAIEQTVRKRKEFMRFPYFVSNNQIQFTKYNFTLTQTALDDLEKLKSVEQESDKWLKAKKSILGLLNESKTLKGFVERLGAFDKLGEKEVVDEIVSSLIRNSLIRYTIGKQGFKNLLILLLKYDSEQVWQKVDAFLESRTKFYLDFLNQPNYSGDDVDELGLPKVIVDFLSEQNNTLSEREKLKIELLRKLQQLKERAESWDYSTMKKYEVVQEVARNIHRFQQKTLNRKYFNDYLCKELIGNFYRRPEELQNYVLEQEFYALKTQQELLGKVKEAQGSLASLLEGVKETVVSWVDEKLKELDENNFNPSEWVDEQRMLKAKVKRTNKEDVDKQISRNYLKNIMIPHGLFKRIALELGNSTEEVEKFSVSKLIVEENDQAILADFYTPETLLNNGKVTKQTRKVYNDFVEDKILYELIRKYVKQMNKELGAEQAIRLVNDEGNNLTQPTLKNLLDSKLEIAFDWNEFSLTNDEYGLEASEQKCAIKKIRFDLKNAKQALRIFRDSRLLGLAKTYLADSKKKPTDGVWTNLSEIEEAISKIDEEQYELISQVLEAEEEIFSHLAKKEGINLKSEAGKTFIASLKEETGKMDANGNPILKPAVETHTLFDKMGWQMPEIIVEKKGTPCARKKAFHARVGCHLNAQGKVVYKPFSYYSEKLESKRVDTFGEKKKKPLSKKKKINRNYKK